MGAKKKLLLILGGAAVLLAALAALVTFLKPEESSQEIPFLSMDSVTRITLQWPEGTTTLELGEEWTDPEDPNYPIRQSILENMATTAQNITAQRQLEDDSQTGLDTPALTVTLENDGESVTFSFGNSNSLTGDYYAALGGSVYTLSEEVYNAFAYTKEGLYAPQAPMELEENLASLEVQWGENTLSLAHDGETWSFAGNSQTQPDQTKVDSLISQLGYTQTSMTITDLAQVEQERTTQPYATVTALGSEAAYFEVSAPDQEGYAWLWDSSTGYLHRVSWQSVSLWLETATAILEGCE